MTWATSSPAVLGHRVDLPAVAVGSHLDTQPHGGKFDGVFGVLAGLEVIRTLNAYDVDTEAADRRRDLDQRGRCQVRTRNARIRCVRRSFLTVDFAHGQTDGGGRTLGSELERIGYLGDEPCGERKLDAYFEAHIEQGPVLEREGRTIGVVWGGQGQRWYDVSLQGQDAHAGSTPLCGPTRRSGRPPRVSLPLPDR